MMRRIVPIAWLMTAAILIGASVGLAARANADETILVCPGGHSGVATTATSCPFAQNVGASWLSNPNNIVAAYSPVTRATYMMQCNSNYQVSINQWPWSVSAVRCVGGDNAVVWVW